MQALIVTCARDAWQFRIQCKSIGQYLEPCDLHIVINEIEPDAWTQWFQQNCLPHLSAHRVTLYTHNDFQNDLLFHNVYNLNGWISQQIFKLAFSLKTRDPYIVLDSKNWFIKHTRLEHIPKRCRIITPSSEFSRFYFEIQKKFQITTMYKYREFITPYHIDPGIVNAMLDAAGGADEFFNWFAACNTPSEFMVYDLFSQQHLLDTDTGSYNSYSKNFWYSDLTLDVDKFKAVLADPDVYMVGIQYSLVKTLNTDQIEALLNIG